MRLRSSSISLDGYGSQIRKVSRCTPPVSNETILATRQGFFFTKVAPLQSISDIVFLDLSQRKLFFRMFMFQWIWHSNVFTCFFVEKGAINSVHTQLAGDPKCVKLRTVGGRGCHASCVGTRLHYLFSCFWQHFCFIVSCFICRDLTLPLSP